MTSTAPTATTGGVPTMSHREVIQALAGLLMGMFVSILAGTVVSTSLPVIVSDLGGSQTSYTWVVTATLLATTVSTPVWGKLADLFDRKLLVQLALSVFVISSAIAGFSQGTTMLITLRVFQGLGAGGLAALSQIIIADIISPRERGKYMGLFGGVMALGTVAGPLVGGFLTDTINWRWNFFIGVPFALAAIIVLQKTLHVSKAAPRRVRIDYLGILLLGVGVSLLLIWVTLAGTNFDWLSSTTFAMVGGAVVLLAAFVLVELRAAEPIVPMQMFRNRTFTLAVIASISVGVAMFGTSVFLAQYMQLARGASATQSGLMTIPMMLGMFVVSTVAGALISKYGYWKRYVVAGTVLLTVGLLLMGTIHYDTNFALVCLFMALLGGGVGMVMQNLVLIVQNTVRQEDLGAASSGVTFFRSLGGAIGIAVLGSIMATTIADMMTERQSDLLAAAAQDGPAGASTLEKLATGTIPAVHDLPSAIKTVVESVYGDGVAHIFTVAVPLAIVAVIACALLPNVPLSTKNRRERLAEKEALTEAA